MKKRTNSKKQDLGDELFAEIAAPGAAPKPKELLEPRPPKAKPSIAETESSSAANGEKESPMAGNFADPSNLIVLPSQDMNLIKLDTVLKTITDWGERNRTECFYLDSIGRNLDSATKIINVRKGIIYYVFKTIAPERGFEALVKERFPNVNDRTRRLHMAQAATFIKKTENFDMDQASAEEIAKCEVKWTSVKVLEKLRQIAENEAPQLPVEASSGAPKKEKKTRSPHVRLETLAANVRRLALALEKTQTNAKRVAAADVAKARELIAKKLPGSIAELVLQHLPTVEAEKPAGKE